MENKKLGKHHNALISIIVPVYNTKKYLSQCLCSLQEQTLSNIEIIVIDDGSTDGSEFICDDFAERDSRFIVIHKKNEGLSVARNTGLEVAKSEYVMFVDSDDWVEPDFCKIPFHIAKQNNSDLVIFQFYQGKKEEKRKPYPKEGLTPKDEVITWLWEYTWALTWNKLYKRELFRGLQYPEGHLYEDDAITYLVAYKSRNIFLLNEYLYHYRNNRPGSITNEKTYQSLEDYFYYRFRRIEDLKKWGYSYKEEEARIAWVYRIRMGPNAEFSSRCDKVLKKRRGCIDNIGTVKHKSAFWLYKTSPLLFDLASIIFGKRVKKKKQLYNTDTMKRM